jgi:hypothetical protein
MRKISTAHSAAIPPFRLHSPRAHWCKRFHAAFNISWTHYSIIIQMLSGALCSASLPLCRIPSNSAS